MNLIDSPRAGVTADASAASDVVDITLHGLLGAYSAGGYEQGYARGARDLLALYPLLIEQFLYDHDHLDPETRRTIRALGRYVEDHAGRRLEEGGGVDAFGRPDDGFADGAGI